MSFLTTTGMTLDNKRRGQCAWQALQSIAICLEGSTERSDGNRGRSPREEAIALILPGRQYATGHAPSLHWCRFVRPTRSPFLLAHSLRVNSWAKKYFPIIRGQKLIRCLLHPRQLQVVSSCSCCRHIPLIALVTIRATDPVAIPVAHCLRVNSCNSWTKIYTRFLSPKNPSTRHQSA